MLPNDVCDFIREGESQTVEFKRSIPPSKVIAKLLAAFANARGGVLLLGVEEYPARAAIGVDADKAEMEVHRATQLLTPSPDVRTSRVLVGGAEVVVVEIGASRGFTLAPDGLFTRVGDSVRPFTPGEAVERMESDPASSAGQDSAALARAVAQLTKQLDDQAPLLKALIKANHWSRKGLWLILGAAAGAVAKALASALIG